MMVLQRIIYGKSFLVYGSRKHAVSGAELHVAVISLVSLKLIRNSQTVEP